MTGMRLRFAPSPTGPIHVGNMHTTLFNWLWARNQGGTFVLRLEDTDQERSTKEWEEVIYQEMKWLGLDWDEGPDIGGPYGPYRQMERLGLYREYAQKLLESGHAYYCYCTPEELEAERKEAEARHVAYKYSRKCRNLTPEERQRLEAEGRKPVIRFKVPDGQTVVFDDLIRGRIETPTDSIGDFVIMRANGIPLYNFAVVIDDVTMKITHVIRGEGHIPNTPVQILIYQALGLPTPKFGHVGHVVNPDHSKLSKRKGEAFVGDFRDKGYLPEALLNFLALLGWTPPDGREFISKEEMIREFSIERVGKTSPVFDIKKLDWMNGHYIRKTDLDRLARLCLPFLQKAGLVAEIPPEKWEWYKGVISTVQDRLVVLSEVAPLTDFFFLEEISYDPAAVKKFLGEENWPILREVRQRLAAVEDFTPAGLEPVVRGLVEEKGLKTKDVFHPLRVAVTGRAVSPGLFETLTYIGKERVLKRLDDVLAGKVRAE